MLNVTAMSDGRRDDDFRPSVSSSGRPVRTNRSSVNPFVRPTVCLFDRPFDPPTVRPSDRVQKQYISRLMGPSRCRLAKITYSPDQSMERCALPTLGFVGVGLVKEKGWWHRYRSVLLSVHSIHYSILKSFVLFICAFPSFSDTTAGLRPYTAGLRPYTAGLRPYTTGLRPTYIFHIRWRWWKSDWVFFHPSASGLLLVNIGRQITAPKKTALFFLIGQLNEPHVTIPLAAICVSCRQGIKVALEFVRWHFRHFFLYRCIDQHASRVHSNSKWETSAGQIGQRNRDAMP